MKDRFVAIFALALSSACASSSSSTSAPPSVCAKGLAGAWTVTDTRSGAPQGACASLKASYVSSVTLDAQGVNYHEVDAETGEAVTYVGRTSDVKVDDSRTACGLVVELTQKNGGVTITGHREFLMTSPDVTETAIGNTKVTVTTADGTSCEVVYGSKMERQ